jgi:hypothetical protein
LQSDRLETDEVVAGGDGGGDRGRPGAVLGDHLTITPVTVVDSAGDQAGLVDLELIGEKKHIRVMKSDCN